MRIRSGLSRFVSGALMSLIVSYAGVAVAHDGWVQSNVARMQPGEMVYIDMQFGNHGNTHRDYKIYASKWDMSKATFMLHSPRGSVVDFKGSVIDTGFDETKTFCGGGTTYVDKNGYLAASFLADDKGIYIVDVRQDTVVSYAPERSIKGAKSIVAAVNGPSTNRRGSIKGYNEYLGQDLEIIPLNDPTCMAVGDTLTVQVLYKGTPLADACLSVIPRGKTLPDFGTATPYDLMTDFDGKASFTFDEANYHLIVVHKDTGESGTLDGKAYTQTKYAATLTVIVSPRR